MSKAIEERFEEFLATIDDAPYLARMPFFAPIIAEWNAMTKVLQQLIDLNYTETAPNAADNHPGWWCCENCTGEKYDHPEFHAPDKCPVAAAQAALARMNGLHDDGTVV